MVQDDNQTHDGADEQMLGSQETEALNRKGEDVKFTKNGDAQNGDAKIEIGMVYDAKDFTGMSKEELMKYANDPLWIRLRWIFFIAFWLIWICMLVAAILIIVGAPKCAAPENLSWFKQGPLLKRNDLNFEPDTLVRARKLQATGVIYEVPADKTYNVGFDNELDEKIDTLVKNYKESGFNLILDLTPNYAHRSSKLFQNALSDESKRSAFVWKESQSEPTNWLALNVNRSAWVKVEPGSFVLSQFGDDLFDLHMNSTIAKNALQDVFVKLIKKGIKGFRLENSKYFIISKKYENESVATDPAAGMNDYNFWTRVQTRFQEGIGDFLSEMKAKVKMIDNDVMLSVADDVVRPEIYKTKEGYFGIDTPRYDRLVRILNEDSVNGVTLKTVLTKIPNDFGNQSWLQWELDVLNQNNGQDASAITLFLSLIPGVHIIPDDSYLTNNVSGEIYKKINTLRNSPSFMHGEFAVYNQGPLVAYSRIKAGSPGFFVVFNPSDNEITENFTVPSFPEKMKVNVFSTNYNISGVKEKSDLYTNAITLSPFSSIIFSYVPVSSG